MKIPEIINLGQAMNFWRDEHFNSFIKDFSGQTTVETLIRLYAEKHPEKTQVLLDKPCPVSGNQKQEPTETPIEKVLGRMYNWKQNSAYNYAKEIPEFPKEALEKLKYLAEKFGNCGWMDGSVYDELRDTNFEVAKMLGYEYNEEEDYYLPIKK